QAPTRAEERCGSVEKETDVPDVLDDLAGHDHVEKRSGYRGRWFLGGAGVNAGESTAREHLDSGFVDVEPPQFPGGLVQTLMEERVRKHPFLEQTGIDAPQVEGRSPSNAADEVFLAVNRGSGEQGLE